MSDKHPTRVLHVVSEMGRGGVETWLLHLLRHLDSHDIQMDFLVTQPERACPYLDELTTHGSCIIPCPVAPAWSFSRRFTQILHTYGPYDVVHCHAHHFSGLVLRIARQAGVPQRIAHSHQDTTPQEAHARLGRRLYLQLTTQWITRNATVGLAASRQAAAALFGLRWRTDPRWRTLYCGIDLTPFATPPDHTAVRAEFGIPDDALVVGHIGRFIEKKNHALLIDIFAEIVRRRPTARLLLVGDGPLRPTIKARVEQVGLQDRVIFAGLRSDVPRLLLGAMDVFVFPSLAEGLGLVLIEAQCAGLPCVYADVIPPEADLVPSLTRRLALSQPATAWAEAALQATASPHLSQHDALVAVSLSPFAIETSLKELEKIYAR